jgi:Asp-tRNA(Asn)/Glu-tRNA(Gln) amidotransferase A subunit family amidase
MEPDQQLALSATAAVAAIAAGELTATAYTTTLLGRAEQLTDRRAVITLNRAGALASAARIDDARRSGTALGRLAGLPIIVKDNINTKDLPTTAGTPALHDFRPTADAAVLQPLLDAGAIILGKANMHELAFGITTTNFSPFAGTATHPYDPARIPGGSSGGTGAAIAARIAPAGLGSDTGASVRIPAAFNGIAGLRPSTGGPRHR